MSKTPLQIGQRVWLETCSILSSKDRMAREYEVVKVNKSSTYVALVVQLEKVLSEGKEFDGVTYRVDQKTHEVKSPFIGYTEILWPTKNAFETDVKMREDLERLRDKAHRLVDRMSAAQLMKLVGEAHE
ncbi:hypothetical protein [Lysinibacillus sp. NPDC047702]|uniref:hypothetical protein n=1 Tax=unclassified Lysinibacillus TaxID=2636778 RepID=UPI003D031B0E